MVGPTDFIPLLGDVWAVIHRHIWGGRSRISIRQREAVETRQWGHGRQNSIPNWSTRLYFLVSNKGFRDGQIGSISLTSIEFDTGEKLSDPSDSLQSLAYEYHFEEGFDRVDLDDIHNRVGRVFPKQDDVDIAVVVFLFDDSEFTRLAEEAREATFTFESTFEDNRGAYTRRFEATTAVDEVHFRDEG